MKAKKKPSKEVVPLEVVFWIYTGDQGDGESRSIFFSTPKAAQIYADNDEEVNGYPGVVDEMTITVDVNTGRIIDPDPVYGE